MAHRATPWGPRPADWSLVEWREFARRSGVPIRVEASAPRRQVTVRVRHRGVVQRTINASRLLPTQPLEQTQVRSGQFIISKIDARNGACGFVPRALDGAVVSSDFPVFDIVGAEPRYLDHLVALPVFWRLCETVSDGSTNRVRLDLDQFDQLPFPMPSLAEQRDIATILDAIDDAIERGGVVIAATKTLRQALLHELLTRGMPRWHSEWKHVPPIGAVPARWTVTTLRDILELDQPGTWGDEAFGEDSVPILRAADFTDDGWLDLTRAPRRSVPKADRDRRLLRDGDLVLERSGGGPGQPVGRVVMAQGLGRAYCSNFCQQLRVDPSTCRPSFALRALQHRHERGATLRMEQRTTGIRNLDYAAYLDFPFPLPTIPEQEAIAGILDSVYAYDAGLAKHLDALRAVKSSAADALLQGRVRTGHARLDVGST